MDMRFRSPTALIADAEAMLRTLPRMGWSDPMGVIWSRVRIRSSFSVVHRMRPD